MTDVATLSLLTAILLITYLEVRLRKRKKNLKILSQRKIEAKESVPKESQKESPDSEQIQINVENKQETKQSASATDKIFERLNQISERVIQILDEFEKRGYDIMSENLPEDLKQLKEEYFKLKKEEEELFNKLLKEK